MVLVSVNLMLYHGECNNKAFMNAVFVNNWIYLNAAKHYMYLTKVQFALIGRNTASYAYHIHSANSTAAIE